MSGFSLIFLVTVLTLNVFADDDSHHHHVIIHVPYKIHTIHHTILKHIHHQKKPEEDKYEVLGYTIGKPIDLSHQLGDSHHHNHYEPHLPPPPPPPPIHRHQPPPHHHHHVPEEMHHQAHPEEMHYQAHQAQYQEFSGGNELGYGHEWEPNLGHEFHGGGYQPSAPHYEGHAQFEGGQEYAGHHEGFGGYD